LLALPDDTLRRILEHLLSTREGKEVIPHKEHHIMRYKLYPQVLRVHSGLNALGNEVLRANHFVTVSTDYPKLCQLFQNNTGHAWTRTHQLLRFKWPYMRLHLTPQVNVKHTDGEDLFMLCQADLHLLVITLKMLAFLNQPRLRFLFVLAKINGELLPEKFQRELLYPFTDIRGHNQICKVWDASKSVKTEVEAKLTQPIYWTRLEYREYVDMLAFKYGLSTDAMTSRKWLTAMDHQEDLTQLQAGGSEYVLHIMGTDDQILNHDLQHLFFLECVNSNLVFLHLAYMTKDATNALRMWRKIVDPNNNPDPDLIPTELALSYQIRGVASFALGRYNAAMDFFEKALDISPKTAFMRCRDMVHEYYSKADPKNAKATLLKMKGFVPFGAVGKPFELRTTILGPVEYQDELLRLRAIGYNGNELDDSIRFENIEGVQMLGADVRQWASEYKQAVKHHVDEGMLPPPVRVGPAASDDFITSIRGRTALPQIQFEPTRAINSLSIKEFVYVNTANWEQMARAGLSAEEMMARS